MPWTASASRRVRDNATGVREGASSVAMIEVPDHPLRPAAEADLARLIPEIERLSGLRTRWVGVVWVREGGFLFAGQKHGWCGISLRGDILLDPPARWRTMIHEGFHSVSAAFGAARLHPEQRAWEEAIVEQCQRLFRQQLLHGIGVDIEEARFREGDQQHPYNRHIRALEAHRASLGSTPETFYLRLLRAGPTDRAALVLAATRTLRVQHPQEP